ncbi:MAG TPA: ribonuclease III [Clostridiales bacterium]|nr:ribonuclease III [Clostridiales bacterium]
MFTDTLQLQEKIGYRFRDPDLLLRAVTHSSYANETGAKNHHLLCNERLEFLGDAVLSVLTGEYLYNRFPNGTEGDLTRIRAAAVCEGALASYAEKIGLREYLRLGRGVLNSGGANNPALLADAFEALLAAIYLDAGADGLNRVREFLLPFIKWTVDTLPPGGGTDPKTALLRFLQMDGPQRLEYRVVSETGPDHDKHFEVELYLDSNRIGRGSGSSKRSAEQRAAADALKLFGVEC